MKGAEQMNYGNSTIWIVSVPLRGSGYERLREAGRVMLFDPFPSPCGEVVMKDVAGVGNGREIVPIQVSVPLRGSGYESIPAIKAALASVSDGFRPLAGKWL